MWNSFFLPSSVDKQDLLKHTPVDHPDCLPLQNALRISQDLFPASGQTLTPLDCSHNGLPRWRLRQALDTRLQFPACVSSSASDSMSITLLQNQFP
ncbi:uncharacterized protein [Macaca nemestrina]|uniref:uncharacterized protein isoform X4 n=1 Tax=Macaca nemestrina TaxID=9545 RepID=UPI0039B9399E